MQRAIPPDVKAHGEGARLDPWPAIGHPTPVPQSPLLAPGGIRLGWREPALAALLYALATVALTWPLFRHPATTVLDTRSLYGPASVLIQRDINLTLWTLAWDTHALRTDPLHLFDANTFYPARYSLALSEHKLGNVPFFAPVYLATGNPVLAYQVTLLLTFVLAGLAMAAYVLYWTDDRGAAFAAGFLFAFAPFRFWQLGSLDYISIHFFPLITLAIDAVLDGAGRRTAIPVLAGALVLSTFCSYYVGYAAFALAIVYAAVRIVARGRGSFATLPRLAGALAAAGIAIAIVTIPYVILQRSGIIPDYGQRGFASLAFLTQLRFGLMHVLSYWVVPHREGVPQFLTYTALSLAALALALRRCQPRAGLVAVGVLGVVLALGPYLLTPWFPPIPLPYAALARVVPGFSAMRVPQRFGALTTFATTGLAALGLAAACATLRARRRAAVAAALPWLAMAAVALEARPGGLAALPMRVGTATPPEYRWLAEHGAGGAVLELPASIEDLHRSSLYMYYSTVHWLPLLNGYTPYPPRSFVSVMEAVKGLPRPEALETVLARAPARWIVLHLDAVAPRVRPDWEATFRAALPVAAELDDAIVFEVPAQRAGPR